MKIAVDSRLLHNQNSGMGKYLSEVLRRLKTISSKYEYYYLDYELPKRNLLEKIFDLIYEQLWIQLLVPQVLRKEKAVLLYSPNPPTSLFVPIPVVLTIPDLVFYFDPNLNWFIKSYLYFVYKLSALKAKKIITFSETSKKNIADILKVSLNKIEVASPSIKEIFGQKLANSKLEQIKKKFGLRKKYILSIPGTFIPRKNVNDLLLSFNSLPLKIKKDFNLVFVGNNKHSSFNEFMNNVRQLQLEDHVIVTGYISEEELKALYQGAFMMVITTNYEGFALPPLEAMRENVPVVAIAYGNSSLSEVVGDAGLIVKDRVGLKMAMIDLITNNKLRRELIKKGLIQEKKYDWDKSVRKLVKIFEDSI